MPKSDLMEYRLTAIDRGYRTGEFSSPTRDHSGLRFTPISELVTEFEQTNPQEMAEGRAWVKAAFYDSGIWAERNGELHVLCHNMLTALEYLDCDYDTLHKFRERLHNVPQCRHAPE